MKTTENNTIQERKKKFILYLRMFGANFYVSNLKMKPYLRSLDNGCSHITKNTRKFIYSRSGHKCEKCCKPISEYEFELHHIIPRSMDGTNNRHNIMCLCKDCHRLIHENPVVAHELINKMLAEHPEVVKEGESKIFETIKEKRKRKTLLSWAIPGIRLMVVQ